jgi:hypothetical protein
VAHARAAALKKADELNSQTRETRPQEEIEMERKLRRVKQLYLIENSFKASQNDLIDYSVTTDNEVNNEGGDNIALVRVNLKVW